jgi:hypothetical protein
MEKENCTYDSNSTNIHYSKYDDNDKKDLIQHLLFRPDIIRKLFMNKDKVLLENSHAPININIDSSITKKLNK